MMTLVGAVLVVVAGSVSGYAIGSFTGVFREMNLNSVFSHSSDPDHPWWAPPTAIFGSLAATGVYSRWNHHFTGRSADFAGIGPGSLWLIGAAAGLWWTTAALWPAPDKVGTAVDPVFGRDTAWGLGDWVWYASAWWLPGLFTVLALVAVLLGVIGRRGRRDRRGRISELLSTGHRVQGTVTAVSGATSPDAALTLLRWTFTFNDINGQARWVERTNGFRHGAAPTIGATITVLYDPARPADKRSIFAAVTGGDSPEDYIRPGM
ncbi:DUF3592 domain-containing protein [Curtobacterium flaccumfaciens]|uniref:DUF3592 domain-containing protein n=2 Tax=Curtobacterium flaccumfaciens TaxID=2035 RepID=UPI0011279E45|nr:DUF3592 domain-containing protein [Curtobacterium flaccumfaciens]